MKKKLFGLLALLALTASATASAVSPKTCADFCAAARCMSGYTCGLYVDASGQTVCGCHT